MKNRSRSFLLLCKVLPTAKDIGSERGRARWTNVGKEKTFMGMTNNVCDCSSPTIGMCFSKLVVMGRIVHLVAVGGFVMCSVTLTLGPEWISHDMLRLVFLGTSN